MKGMGKRTRTTRFFRAMICMFVLSCLAPWPAFATDLGQVKKAGVLRHLSIPYANFVSGAGDGMDVELMKLFAEHLGVGYENVRTDWDVIFSNLTGKTFEVTGPDIKITGDAPVKGDVAACGITVIGWREKLVDFSNPTFPNQVWLVARADSPLKPINPSGNTEKDIAAVKKLVRGRSLIGKANTCLDPALYGLDKEGARIVAFKGGLNDIAAALIKGEAQLTLLDVPDALVALQKWPGKIKVIGPVSGFQVMSVAFNKDARDLKAEFNRFLDKIKKNGAYQEIVKRYYPFVFGYFPEFFKKKK